MTENAVEIWSECWITLHLISKPENINSVVLWQPAVPAPTMIDASIVARLVKEVEELLNHVTNENFEAAVDTARVLQQANLGKQFPP